MPRPTLPAALKMLKTMEVVLTKTTQEEIWEHFNNVFLSYDEKANYFFDILVELEENISQSNPFARASFSTSQNMNNYPARKYADAEAYKIFDKENEFERYLYLFKIKSDLERCNSSLNWDKDDEKKDQYITWVNKAYKVCEKMKWKLNSLSETEHSQYFIAKRNWENANKEQIEREKLMNDHKFHRSINYFEDLFKSDPYRAELWYRNVMPLYVSECVYCIRERETQKLREEQMFARAVQQQQEAEEDRKYRKMEEQIEREIEEEKRQELESQKHTCEMCEYTTSSGSKYDIHLASKEHISKSRSKAFYCKPCETQSRSQLEHENHCNSSKHKKKTGEIVEPENYHCEPCNFTTPSKHLFKQHNEGKKHKKKMSSGGS